MAYTVDKACDGMQGRTVNKACNGVHRRNVNLRVVVGKIDELVYTVNKTCHSVP